MSDNDNHLDIETLSAYADGELNAVGTARADRHVAGCAECGDALRQVRELVGAARALARDITPPAEVWTSLRERVARDRLHSARRWWHNGWLASAAALLLIVGTAVLTSNTVPRAKATKVGGQTPPPASGGHPASRLTPNAVFAVDRNYAATLTQLRETLEFESKNLSPSTFLIVERSLAVIDSAIAEARAALASDPANHAIVDILSAHYERKVELLTRATELSSL